MRVAMIGRLPTMLAGALALLLFGLVPARAATLEVHYGLWLAGLPIGSGELKGSFEGTQYRLDLKGRLSGLGALVGGDGSGTASGSMTSARPTPSAFAARARTSAGERTLRMGIAGGNVVSVAIDPPLEDKADRVPLAEVHKRAIIDPLSAVIAPAATRGPLIDAANCNRTVPIFDGGTRFDVVLSYGGTRTVEKAGYNGPVLVCNVRYVPIAGHRMHRPATKFMTENRDISVGLAPVAGARGRVPFRISVKTMIGTSVVEATRWAYDGPQIVPISGQRLRNPKSQ
jgi:hypothetical protein